MAALSVCGVALPVRIDALKASLEAVGAVGRNVRGHRVLERRRNKWVFEFELTPVSLDEAQLFKALLLGEGEFWSLAASAYGAKGLAITGTGSWNSTASTNPFTSTGTWRLTTGQTMVVPGRFYDQSALTAAPAGQTGATAIGWRYDAGTASWRVFGWVWRAQDAAPHIKREKLGALGASGAAQAYTGSETFAVSGGNLTVTAPGAGGAWHFSNVLVLPWALAQAQLDTLLDGFASCTYQQPALPDVYVQTDLLPTDQLKATPGLVQASLICQGELEAFEVVPLVAGGVWSKTEVQLSGRLVEV